MAFRIVWTEQAKDSLNRLEREDIIRIVHKVESSKSNPYLYAKKLAGKDIWRIRVGDFRVLLDLDSLKEVLYVLEVGHRKNIYKW
jgi:mRNA interferase RelE/StbE